MNIEILDKGHYYRLPSLDGNGTQPLFFVKRVGEKFPGNTNAYSGTTMQFVIRALLERMRYLQNQVWSAENVVIIFLLQTVIWLLEFRAARRHNRSYWHSLDFAEKSEACKECGHTDCNQHEHE